MKVLRCACGQVLSAETGAALLEAVEAHLAEVLATTEQHDRHAEAAATNGHQKGESNAG